MNLLCDMGLRRLVALAVIGGVGLGAAPRAAQAVSPESPEVKAVIDKGLAALENGSDERLGGQALIALCFWKAGRGIQHHKIQDAIKACKAQSAETLGRMAENYSLGIATLFLCELEQQDLHELTQMYVDTLLKRQMPHGGWGYTNASTGDTSQTQYAALALWMAKNKGFEVPQENVEKLAGWLLRTQDPSGSWGYQGKDPGAYVRVTQSYSERLSLLVAGLGSVYICADMLGVTDIQQPREERDTPAALQEVKVEQPAEKNRDGVSKAIDPAIFRRSMADGNQCFSRNYKFDIPMWKWYYIYGMERYLSYRELTERKKEKEPKWYNDGFAFLQGTQMDNGMWPGDEASSTISTCFAVLFLLRSSGKAVAKANPQLGGEGVLLGRMGLPANTADIRERDGKIVETPLAGSVDELLALIEKPDHPDLAQLVDSAGALKLESDVTKRSGQIARLRALVSAGSYEARLVAVRALGRVRDLDNVPVLIYALTDGDVRVVREADKALRFLSRKFQGVGLPEDPKPEDKEAAVKAWKDWYLSVRPDGEFLD
jgi:hypothetical protein